MAVIAVWLWLTVLFANFAEAIAEGRGKAQANALRATRTTTLARLRDGREVPGARAPERRRRGRRGGRGDPRRRRDHRGRRLGRRVCDHRRVGTGHPRGRRRPLRRHRRHEAALRPARDRGHAGAGQVVPRPDDRARRGRRAPQDAERNRAQHPPCRTDHHLRGCGRDAEAVRDLRRDAAVSDRPDRPARRADPDHDRCPALGDRDRRHGSPRPAERAGDVGPRRRGLGRRRRAPARQDRDDHARQPPGGRVPPCRRRRGAGAGRGRAARLARRRNARGPLDRRAGEGAVRPPRARARRAQVHPVQRDDADERDRPERQRDPQGRGRRGQDVRRRARREPARRARRDRPARRRAGRDAARRLARQLGARRRPPEGHRQGRDDRALRRAAARWASAR